MTLPPILYQSKAVQTQTEVLLMRRNKWIYTKGSFKLEIGKSCKELKIPLPDQEIINANAKFFQNVMNDQKGWKSH